MNIIEILLTDVPDAAILGWPLFWVGAGLLALGIIVRILFPHSMGLFLGILFSSMFFVFAIVIPPAMHGVNLADSVKNNLVSEGLMVIDINYPDSPTFTAVTFDGDIVVGTMAFTEKPDGVLATFTYTNSITSKE